MYKKYLNYRTVRSYVLYLVITLSLLFTSLFVSQLVIVNNRANAACSTDTTDLGTVTNTIDVKSAATYRAWVRIKAPNNTANSVFLEVDGNCYKMGDKQIESGKWTWIDYRDGNTNNKANIGLTAGQKTVKIIGREQNVLVDKVIFTTYTECVPLNASDVCAPPADTTKPTVNITSPTSNSSVSGTINVTVNANDNDRVNKVDLLVDGSVVNSDSQAPYTFQLDTTKLSEGNHSIVAKATDASGNLNTSSPITITVSNSSPDLEVTAVTWSPISPKVNDDVTFKATVKNTGEAPILNASNVRVEFEVDGTIVSFSEQNIVNLSAGQSIIFTANGGPEDNTTWKATSGSHTFKASIDTTNLVKEINESNNNLQVTSEVASLDTQAPTVSIVSPTSESIVSGEVIIAVNASDEGVSLLSRVEFFIGNKLIATDGTQPFSFTWDTTDYEGKFYELRATAYDNAGNSANSEKILVEVRNNPVDVVEDEDKEFENTENDNNNETPSPSPQPDNNPPTPAPQPQSEDPQPTILVPLENVTLTTVDIDGNNIVDEFDLSLFFNEWGQQSNTAQISVDFNSDGIVNVFDLSILLSNWSF